MIRPILGLLLSIMFWGICAGSMPPPPPQSVKPDIKWFFEALKNADNLQVLEGLPHPFWEPEERAKELSTHQTISIAKEVFYSPQLAIGEDAKKDLTSGFMERNLFTPQNPNAIIAFKQCGGFHADYGLRWLKKDTPIVSALICFGCDEIRVVSADMSFTADMTESGYEYLAETLKPLRTLRPPFGHLNRLRELKKQLSLPENPGKIQIKTE